MTGSVTPPHWLSVPLENVILRIVGGGTPSKSNPEYYQGEIPWMSVKDMNKHVLQDTADHISQAAVDNSSTNVIPAGTPIVATRMSLGKIVVADFDSAINQDLKALFLPAEVHRDYLVYWYRSVARQIERMGTGTTVKGIRLEVLKGLDFALPPLAEQKVIADKLDTLLAQAENTKARLERIPQILKRFRQSVLASAVSGRLTEEWRGDFSYIDLEVGDETVPIPLNWASSDIGGIIDGSRKLCYGVVQPGTEVSGGTPLIRVCDIQQGEIDWRNLRSISLEIDDQYRRSKVKRGDILVTIVGAIGRVGIIRDDTDANIARAVARVSPNESLVQPFYVHCWLSSPTMQWWLVNASKEVARKTLNLKELKTAPIPVPPLEEQTEIVRRVDQLFAHADRIEQQVNNALTRVNHLTQSILAKAFRGELTEQWRKDNPELISGENSAEALLERIKAERATQRPEARRKKIRNTEQAAK